MIGWLWIWESVLRAIKFVAGTARKMQIPLNVRGEMASNPT
ncbi:MAG: hypothetical protein ACREEM_25515 [Blastocatellia bacterium]